jgi:hypothetical protein
VLQVPDGPPTPGKLLAAGVPPERWLTINAGDGAKGKRWYAWMSVELAPAGAPGGLGPPAAHPPQPADRSVGLLPLRRPGHTAVGRPGAGGRVPLAGGGGLQAAKGLCRLDEHQVRCWRSWYRWVTLAMLAYAFLVVAARTERDQHPHHQG